MDNKVVSIYTILFLIIGAVLAGVFATNNQTNSKNSFQILSASMIEPTPAAVAPRTYNQTLVESIDTSSWQTSIEQAGYPVPTAIHFDILPDSFNIQTTINFSESIDDTQKTGLPILITNLITIDSEKLTTALFDEVTPKVVTVKTIGESTVIQQSPVAASLYGAIAGALFGLFLGLALTGSKK